MLVARLCQASSLRVPFSVSSLARQPVLAKAQISSQNSIRNLANQTRVSRATRIQNAETAVKRTTVPAAPYQIGQGVMAGGAAIGLGALAYYGLGMSSEAGTIDTASLWPQYVRERVRDTYLYLAGSLGLTAASTMAIYRSPNVLRLFCFQGPLGAIIAMVGLVALGTAMRSIPYEPGMFNAKHFMWMLHSSMVGGIIAPLCFLGGPLLVRAAIITAGVVGGLSTVAVCAPSEKFLNMAGPLAVGFGVVLASCIGTMFVAPTSVAGASMHSIAVYGGVLLFSMLLLYHTQHLMKQAQVTPYYQQFDPINASSGMYMSIINLFVNIVQVLAFNKRK